MRLVLAFLRAFIPERVRSFLKRTVILLVRVYIRYAPFGGSKRSLIKALTRSADPYLFLGSRRFVASTVFGTQISGDTTDLLQRYIYFFGVWEPHLTRWIQGRLAPGATFIDVGANIGYYSLLASTLVGASGAVVAIEASPRTFNVLLRNLARNGARNIRAVNTAASDSNGVLRLFRGPEWNIGTTSIIENGFELEGLVDAAPLTAILTREEAENARLIKIDVEGWEFSVVAGMAPLLSSGRHDLEIIVEIHPDLLIQQGKRTEDLLKLFLDAGFHAYELENDYLPLAYVPPYPVKRPVRMRSLIEDETILVFSRQDADAL